MKTKAVFIVGTTASGKTSASIKLAKKVGGEIICADSQTLRKDLNIATAKPTISEQSEVRHHLIDVIEPCERYSVARFKKDASNAINDVVSRGKLPIIVGGTGLYIDALFFDYDLETNNNKREELEKLSVKELQEIIINKNYTMPKNKQNPRHLIGVIARGNKNPSNIKPVAGYKIYGIKKPDTEIKDSISLRVEKMFKSGLVDEVQNIIKKYGPLPEKLDAIGYPIVQKYLKGTISLEEAKEVFKRADWQYARRQKAWFKRNQFIQWSNNGDKLVESVIKDLHTN